MTTILLLPCTAGAEQTAASLAQTAAPEDGPQLLMPLTALIRPAPAPGASGAVRLPRTPGTEVLSAQGRQIRALLDGPGSGSAPSAGAPSLPGPGVAPAPPGTELPPLVAAAPGVPEPTTLTSADLDLAANAGPGGAVVLIIGPGGNAAGVLVGGDGLVLTTWHGLRGHDRVAVAFKREGATVAAADSLRVARLIAHSKFADLALLRVASPPAGYPVADLAAGTAGVDGAVLHAVAPGVDGTWRHAIATAARLRPGSSWYSPRRVLHRADVIRADLGAGAAVREGPLFDGQLRLVGFAAMVRRDRGELIGVAVTTLRSFLAAAG